MKKKKMDRYFKAAVLGCLLAITIHERVYGWALVYMFLLSHMDKVLQEVGEEHKNILICHPWKKGKHSKEGKRGGEDMYNNHKTVIISDGTMDFSQNMNPWKHSWSSGIRQKNS